MTEHRSDCQRTGWTETTSHTGTKTWRCNDCHAVTIPTLLAQTIAQTMAGKTIEQGVDDLIQALRIPESVSVSAKPVRQERAPRARAGHTSCTHAVFAQVRGVASDSVSAGDVR